MLDKVSHDESTAKGVNYFFLRESAVTNELFSDSLLFEDVNIDNVLTFLVPTHLKLAQYLAGLEFKD